MVETPQAFADFQRRFAVFYSGAVKSSNQAIYGGDVAFYNFVQFLVGGESRIRPTQEMWRNSIPAFSEIISNLNPLQILVLGKANWSNLLTHIEHVKDR
jgi:hypothetical protein